MSRRRWCVLLAILFTVLATATSCGGTTLDAQPTFDGTWQVTELRTAGVAIDAAGTVMVISIVTTEASLEGLTGCNRIFGSYTLVDDPSGSGDASFTIPSTGSAECSAAEQAREDALVETLEQVTGWERSGSTLTFSRPADPQRAEDRLVLIPAG